MKKDKIVFLVSTAIIVVFQGFAEIFVGFREESINFIMHLGYPEYFVYILVIFKILGGLALATPSVPSRVKEWAYAGFGFDFIFAFLSHYFVDGFGAVMILPVFFMAILIVSYVYWNRLR